MAISKIAGKRKQYKNFKVNDDRVFEVLDKIRKKKDIEANLVTCFEISVGWLVSKYSEKDIIKIIGE